MVKSRIKQLFIDDLGVPVSGCRQFGRELEISSADTYGKVWGGENTGVSFLVLEKIVKGMGLDPDKTPLSALFDFGTGYKATPAEVLRKDARGRELAQRAADHRAGKTVVKPEDEVTPESVMRKFKKKRSTKKQKGDVVKS